MTYGTQACSFCYGYGIKLQLHETVAIKAAIRHGSKPVTIQRKNNYPEFERCPECKGTGWVFVADYPYIILPYNTWNR